MKEWGKLCDIKSVTFTTAGPISNRVIKAIPAARIPKGEV